MKRVKTAIGLGFRPNNWINFDLRILVDTLVTTGSRKIVDPAWSMVYSNLTLDLREELNNAMAGCQSILACTERHIYNQ